MTDAIEAGARAIDAMLDEKTWTNDVPPRYEELAKACIEAAIASGALVPASAVAEMPDGAIDRVAEAIAARAIERGHPIKPVVVRHVAVAAIEAGMAAFYKEQDRQKEENSGFCINNEKAFDAFLNAAVASGALVQASAVAEMRERCIQAVRHAKSLDENGYITEKSSAIEAMRQLDLAPASGDYVVVPREPSEASLNAARDWSRQKYGKPIGNDAAIGCYRAMLNAATRTGGEK